MRTTSRRVLAGLRVLLLLSVAQLLLSVVLVSEYATWFRTLHPGTPTVVVLIALAIRSLVAVGWLSSYRSMRSWLEHPRRRAGAVALTTSAVLVIAYGWLASGGGPWWLEALRLTQLGVAVALAALLLRPTARRQLSTT